MNLPMYYLVYTQFSTVLSSNDNDLVSVVIDTDNCSVPPSSSMSYASSMSPLDVWRNDSDISLSSLS